MLKLTGKQLIALEHYSNNASHLIHLATLKAIVNKGISTDYAKRIVEYSYTQGWHGGRIEFKRIYTIPDFNCLGKYLC